MRRSKPWLFAVCTALLFVLAAWAAGSLLGLSGRPLWILWGGFLLLGLIAAVIVLFLARRAAAAAPPADAADEEIDNLLAAAQSRLLASGATGAGKFGKLPLVLVLGPSGSTKTSVVVHSGLEPELLAGEALRGEVPVPTSSVNVWFAQGTIVVEAGGKLAGEPSRWQRLVQRIQPSRAAAVLSRGVQAPRLALVCFGCDELLKPGAAEAVPAAARRLRARLAEASERLGIRLPVYVLFTRADRLPYFDDYVRSLSRDEAREVLGATLPVAPPAQPGAYAEHQSQRLQHAFRQIIHSLALKRLDVLPREVQEEVRAGAYEFPRELRKASDLAVQFLLELTRPSQLAASPFLRGFYFTGVRAIVVGDAAPVPAPAQSPAPAAALDATSVFNPRALQAAQAHAPPPAGARKVPEWVFLSRIFREVILRDRTAMGITAGGTRVNLLRRALIGAAAAFFLILAGGSTASFFANRSLERAARAAVAGTEGLEPAQAELAPVDALARLDALRAQTERLRRYEQQGRPWRLGWGLYAGDRLLPTLRSLYFREFERLLWTRTRGRVLAALQGLPAEPNETSEYQATYDLLKAHLVTTSHGQHADSAFLAPVLLARWAGDAQPDSARLALARAQFAFFATELPFGNPYGDEPAEALVAQTRAFLGRFAGLEPFYQALVAEASRAAQPVRFAAAVPTAAGVLVNEFTVPGAYTAEGWTFVRENLDNLDALFARENWVVGERALSPEDRARLAQEARSRYVGDYIDNWIGYLRAGSVPGFGGVAAAARGIARFSDNQSPLLQMLAIAARNTAVDSAGVRAAFQPLHQVIPPDQADRLINDANAPYMAALVSLQSALDQVAAAAGPERASALSQAADNAGQAKLAVRQLAQSFSIEGEARLVGDAVQRLLLAPITGAEGVITNLPAAEVNAKGASFCQAFTPITRKYPFNPRSLDDATVDELNAAFQPGGSALWAFYDDALQNLLVRQGSRYAARVGAAPQPSTAFLAFFNQAAEISRMLYDESGGGPHLTFFLRPHASSEIPEITVIIDAQRQTFSRTMAAGQTFDWVGESAREARIIGRVNNVDVTLLEARGTWAVFRLFQQAEWQDAGGGRYALRWRFPDRNLTLTAELSLEERVPIFRQEYLGRLSCVSRIAR